MPTRSGKGWCTWHAVSRISSNHGSHTRVRTAHTHYITCLFVLPCSFFLLKGIKTFANLKERSAKRLTVPQSQWWHPIIRKRHGSRLFCSINHFAASGRTRVFLFSMTAARLLMLRVHICNFNSMELSPAEAKCLLQGIWDHLKHSARTFILEKLCKNI